MNTVNVLKMNPSDYVKYLGVLYLFWDYQINQETYSCNFKTSDIFVPGCLLYICPRDVLINVYYSIFYSH